ncbi:MAG: hypothetical protein KAY24_04200 [Candidatus Eisenbacteria sp.]|nr:hypothetical protein [Candidatus Eisenbacteria bacterium]
MKPEHVVLLGDLKGTKAGLVDQTSDAGQKLAERMAVLHGAFARLVLEYIDRSRTMYAYCFSDSVLVRWDDATEAERFAPSIASKLWGELQQAGLPFRVFIDSGTGVSVADDVGHAIQGAVGRYHHVVPVSMAVWSVFVAEESHFPDGVFIGKNFATRLSDSVLGSTAYKAGPFTFFKMQEGG